MDNGAAFRTFEGEDDLNHHGTSGTLCDVQTQLQTSVRLCVRVQRRSQGGTATVVGQKNIDKMMREDVHTRAELTTPTKDKHIHVAASVYRRMTEDPSVRHRRQQAAVVFHYKRNKEAQPVGIIRPIVHAIDTNAAYCRHLGSCRPLQACVWRLGLAVCAKDAPVLRPWQSKRGPTGYAAPSVGQAHAPIRHSPVYPRPVKRRMTRVATMQASAKALAEKRRACVSA